LVRRLRLDVPGPGLHEELGDLLIAAAGLTVYVRHTSASITIQENADPAVLRDLAVWLARLVPEGDALYSHTAEGPDDMPSHIKSALTQTSVSIPIQDGRLTLGTWQGIYLWEHRRRPQRREVVVHVGA
jgi:secondary thiamine-phosphate synthase enzyme